MRRASLPQQPKFDEPISPDSSNAAARYLWLFARLDPDLARDSGWLADDLNQLRIIDGSTAISADEVCTRLKANEEWLLALVNATRLDSFDLHASDDPSAAPFRDDDPRRPILSFFNGCRRILRDDAIRLWTAGDHAAAVERAASMVRLGTHLAPRNAELIHALSADMMIEYGERLLEKMHTDAESKGLDRSIFAPARSAVARVHSGDPGGIRTSWVEYRRRMLAYAQQQLDEKSTGFDLAIRRGELRAVQVMVDRMFEPLHEAIKTGNPPTEPFDPAKTLRSPETRQRLAETAREIAGVSVEELTDRYEEAAVLGAELEARWGDPNAKEFFATTDKKIDADKTGMLMLLLATPRGAHKKWRESVDLHARVLQWLESGPSVSPPP